MNSLHQSDNKIPSGKASAKRLLTILLIIVFLVSVTVHLFHIFQVHKFSYERSNDVCFNPYTGFAPNADFVDAVGENRLVYVDVTWRELEPEKGSFDFQRIREINNLEEWKAMGKNVVFRFICDYPSDRPHMDIPEWLYRITGDGNFYSMNYGMGYSPNYENGNFIEYHRRAIEALGKEFGQDDFFAYVELGSVGHWGEWHVNYEAGIERLPGWDLLVKYVEPYITAFPNSKLMMRRPFPAATEYNLGLYNDMAGHPEATKEWLSWISEGSTYIEPKTDINLPAYDEMWNIAPVGGEFTSTYPMETMLVDNINQTLELINQSHMTFIGPNCPIACYEDIEYPDRVNDIRKSLGYCFGVSEADVIFNRFTGKVRFRIVFNNYGNAPLYFDWPVCIYVLDEEGNITDRIETGHFGSEIACNDSMELEGTFRTDGDSKTLPLLGIGVENPKTGLPEIGLDMKVLSQSGIYYLNR